eukprot:gnl/Trimastix_PCT/2271.p1 GENE.gnl/Trimastix_PCT/2271~~gnl/Trimastix_PCT/2271.p1  ORF type:complete len:549 (+),score=157.15 gnl/Trimastix_PCT/2271:50-1696(+)
MRRFLLLCVLIGIAFAASVPKDSHKKRIFGVPNEGNVKCDSAFDTHGGIVLYIVAVAYLFVGLAIVCEGYFVSALEVLTDKLKLPPDFTGATFMAAGASAPEMFSAFLGLFVQHSQMGTGTIVGSCVFNLLAIIGVVALVAGKSCQLDWRILLRDSFFYLISILCLFFFVRGGKILWWHTVIFIVVYILYAIVAGTFMPILKKIWPNIQIKGSELPPEEQRIVFSDPAMNAVLRGFTGEPVRAPPRAPEMAKRTLYYGSCENAYDEGPARPRHILDASPEEENTKHTAPVPLARGPVLTEYTGPKDGLPVVEDQGAGSINAEAAADQPLLGQGEEHRPEAVAAPNTFFPRPKTIRGWVTFIVTFPYFIVFKLTMPDCRKKRWRNWFPLTLCVSVVWTGALVYVMMAAAGKVGCLMHIDSGLMGLTVGAVGTSVPNLLASFCVAKYSPNMAVANAIGSNTFDILFAIGVPWFVKTCIVTPGSYIVMHNHGINFSIIILIASLVLLFATLLPLRLRLYRAVGLVYIIVYVLYLVYVSLDCYHVFPWSKKK